MEDHRNEDSFYCDICNKLLYDGFTDTLGFCCCEDCFDEKMNNVFGKDKWRSTNDEGASGGFYEFLNDDGNWEDTGIFWTEFC